VSPCTFIQSEEKGASMSVRNACLKCGKSKEAHMPRKPARIKIYFQGKFWIFANWEEAREKGFYLIS